MSVILRGIRWAYYHNRRSFRLVSFTISTTVSACFAASPMYLAFSFPWFYADSGIQFDCDMIITINNLPHLREGWRRFKLLTCTNLKERINNARQVGIRPNGEYLGVSVLLWVKLPGGNLRVNRPLIYKRQAISKTGFEERLHIRWSWWKLMFRFVSLVCVFFDFIQFYLIAIRGNGSHCENVPINTGNSNQL